MRFETLHLTAPKPLSCDFVCCIYSMHFGICFIMEANTMNFDQSAPDLEARQQLRMVFGGLVVVGGMKKGVDHVPSLCFVCLLFWLGVV